MAGRCRRILIALVAGALIAPAQPAFAYEQTGAFTSGGTALLPSGVSVAITTGAAPDAAGTIAVSSPASTTPVATTSPAAASGSPGLTLAISDAGPIDSAYHAVGTIEVNFSLPVRNPRLHIFDLGSAAFATRLVLTTPGIALVPRAGWSGWNVSSTQIAPATIGVSDVGGCAPGGQPRGCGSIELLGLVRGVSFRVDAARTTIDGADTSSGDNFEVNATVDDDLGSAPASYGSAAHVISDLAIGAGVTVDNIGTTSTAQTADTNDGVITFPALSTASAGSAYAIAVPVSGVGAPATLAGWIDLNGNGHFDAAERATASVAPGATSVLLRWPSLPRVVPGTGRPVRLRLGYDATRVGVPTGYADSGEVDDRVVTIVPADFGDAPTWYGSAAEPLRSGLSLGAQVSADLGPVADKGGIFDGRGDRDDALTTFPPVTVGAATLSVTLPITNTTGAGATLAGWIDLDGNGTFDASERVLVAVPAGATSATLTWTDLSRARIGDSYARLRLDAGASTGLRPIGAGTGGEIEDYPVRVHALPVISQPAAGALLDTRTPAISGSAEPGGALTVTDGATALCTATVTGGGTWACSPTAPLADGSHTLTATDVATDGDRQVGASVAITIDATPPVVPIITAPAADSWISTATPTISGAGESGASIIVRTGSQVVCTTKVIAGAWACRPAVALTEGADPLIATATDPAGNGAAGATVMVHVDITPPPAPVITSPADRTTVGGHAMPMISGTGEPGDTVTIADTTGTAVCVATVNPGGTWSCTATQRIPDGTVDLTPTATDLAGNSTPGEPIRILIDTTVPPPAVITSPLAGAAINTAKPSFAGTGEPGDTVSIVSGSRSAPGAVSALGPASAPANLCVATVDPAGAWTCTATVPLAAGPVSLTPVQIDLGGNTTSGTPIRITVDLTPPPAPVIIRPGEFVDSHTPLITGTGEVGDAVTVAAGSGPVCTATVVAGGGWSCVPHTSLPSGAVTLTATATDPAGNATAGSPHVITIDTTPPPAATVTSPVNGSVTDNPRIVLTGRGEPFDTVDVTDGRGADVCVTTIAAGGAWTCTAGRDLPDGSVALTPTVTDRAGNLTPGATTVVLVDTAPPPAPLITGPAAFISTHKPAVAGTGEPGDTVTVVDSHREAVCAAVVGAAPAGAASGQWHCVSARTLPDGSWTLIATATDRAGNSTTGGPHTFVIDTTAPAAPRITTPANGSVTRDRQPTIRGTGEVGSLIAVRSGATLVCSTTVAAGTVAAGPASTGTVVAGGAWSCRGDTPVADGTVTLVATASDRAGNATHGSASSFTVDATPPVVASITTPEPGTTVFSDTPVISGTGEPDDTVLVSSGDTTLCLATVQSDRTWSCPVADPLPDGAITLVTVATDPAGNQSTAPGVHIRIDSELPVAAVIAAPADGSFVGSVTPLISGTGEAGDTVRVTQGPITVCTSVVNGNGNGEWACRPGTALAQGAVLLTPLTVDGEGSEIPGSPIGFTVDTVPPPAPRITGSGSTFSGTAEAGDSIDLTDSLGADICSTQAAASGKWTCAPARPLPQGSVTITPTATDRAGNVTPGTPVTVS